MSSAAPLGGGLSHLADSEAALVSRIDEAADVLRHSDCFDEEERAEIHAILQALRHESVYHGQTLQRLQQEAGSA